MIFKKALILILLTALLAPALPAGAEILPHTVTPVLPEGMSGIRYANRIHVLGDQPMLFRFHGAQGIANTFPDGLQLSESGMVSGTPGVPGDYQFAVTITNPAGTATAVVSLRIVPYDEGKLAKGGERADIIGAGGDAPAGLANSMNGGRVTMQGDTVFFIDAKGYLCSLDAPFTGKPVRLFSALAYANIDSNDTTLYYYQRYLDNEATKSAGQSVFVTRIAQDPIAGKGRSTLANLRAKGVSDLKATKEVLVYIDPQGVMNRIILKNKDAAELRTYYAGREIKADHALPFNGSVWFRQAGTGHLFKAALDGQLAIRLTQDKVLCYTIIERGGEPRLLYADADRQLYSLSPSDDVRKPMGTLKASALNANGSHVFFADAANGDRLSMFPGDKPDEAVRLSDMAADQIYAFDNYVAFQKKGSKSLYLLAFNSGEEPVLISK